VTEVKREIAFPFLGELAVKDVTKLLRCGNANAMFARLSSAEHSMRTLTCRSNDSANLNRKFGPRANPK
jgi:hypothetical protein